MLKKLDKTILLIVLIALGLRLTGLVHGFPFITHPDEPSIIRSATGIRFDPNPAHFDWPHMQFYLNFIVYMIFIKFRGLLQILNLRDALEPIFPLLWRDPLVFYFISRKISIVMGALTVIPVYLTGKVLFSKKAGRFAALAFAIIPFHVWHSHYALIDVPMTFWFAWAIYFSSRILQVYDMKNYILAGLFVGLAASTKYNGALGALVVLFAHMFGVLRSEDEPLISFRGIKNLTVSGVFAISGFIIGTPFAVFDYDTFLRTDGPKGALWQFTNVGKVSLETQFRQMGENFIGKLAENFGHTFIVVYVLTFFQGIVANLRRKKFNYNLWFVLIPSLIFFFYISGFEKTRSHYYMITYPFVALAVGYLVSWFLSYERVSIASKFVVVLVYLLPLIFTVRYSVIMMRSSTYNILYDWVKERSDETDLVLYDANEVYPVIEKLDGEIDKIDEYNAGLIEDRDGYYIRHIEDAEVIRLQSIESEEIELVYTIDNKLRDGPSLWIYRF